VILRKNFFLIDYSHNKIEKIKNELNWACCNDLQDYGALEGGFLDFSSGMVFLITVMFKPEQSTTVLFRDG
jgi:hypothetical protein